MHKTLDSQLAMNELDMAIRRRGTGPQILHSDQGSTYSTAQYREMLAKHAIRQSMSRKGDPKVPLANAFPTPQSRRCNLLRSDQRGYG